MSPEQGPAAPVPGENQEQPHIQPAESAPTNAEAARPSAAAPKENPEQKAAEVAAAQAAVANAPESADTTPEAHPAQWILDKLGANPQPEEPVTLQAPATETKPSKGFFSAIKRKWQAAGEQADAIEQQRFEPELMHGHEGTPGGDRQTTGQMETGVDGLQHLQNMKSIQPKDPFAIPGNTVGDKLHDKIENLPNDIQAANARRRSARAEQAAQQAQAQAAAQEQSGQRMDTISSPATRVLPEAAPQPAAASPETKGEAVAPVVEQKPLSHDAGQIIEAIGGHGSAWEGGWSADLINQTLQELRDHKVIEADPTADFTGTADLKQRDSQNSLTSGWHRMRNEPIETPTSQAQLKVYRLHNVHEADNTALVVRYDLKGRAYEPVGWAVQKTDGPAFTNTKEMGVQPSDALKNAIVESGIQNNSVRGLVKPRTTYSGPLEIPQPPELPNLNKIARADLLASMERAAADAEARAKSQEVRDAAEQPQPVQPERQTSPQAPTEVIPVVTPEVSPAQLEAAPVEGAAERPAAAAENAPETEGEPGGIVGSLLERVQHQDKEFGLPSTGHLNENAVGKLAGAAASREELRAVLDEVIRRDREQAADTRSPRYQQIDGSTWPKGLNGTARQIVEALKRRDEQLSHPDKDDYYEELAVSNEQGQTSVVGKNNVAVQGYTAFAEGTAADFVAQNAEKPLVAEAAPAVSSEQAAEPAAPVAQVTEAPAAAVEPKEAAPEAPKPAPPKLTAPKPAPPKPTAPKPAPPKPESPQPTASELTPAVEAPADKGVEVKQEAPLSFDQKLNEMSAAREKRIEGMSEAEKNAEKAKPLLSDEEYLKYINQAKSLDEIHSINDSLFWNNDRPSRSVMLKLLEQQKKFTPSVDGETKKTEEADEDTESVTTSKPESKAKAGGEKKTGGGQKEGGRREKAEASEGQAVSHETAELISAFDYLKNSDMPDEAKEELRDKYLTSAQEMGLVEADSTAPSGMKAVEGNPESEAFMANINKLYPPAPAESNKAEVAAGSTPETPEPSAEAPTETAESEEAARYDKEKRKYRTPDAILKQIRWSYGAPKNQTDLAERRKQRQEAFAEAIAARYVKRDRSGEFGVGEPAQETAESQAFLAGLNEMQKLAERAAAREAKEAKEAKTKRAPRAPRKEADGER